MSVSEVNIINSYFSFVTMGFLEIKSVLVVMKANSY